MARQPPPPRDWFDYATLAVSSLALLGAIGAIGVTVWWNMKSDKSADVALNTMSRVASSLDAELEQQKKQTRSLAGELSEQHQQTGILGRHADVATRALALQGTGQVMITTDPIGNYGSTEEQTYVQFHFTNSGDSLIRNAQLCADLEFLPVDRTIDWQHAFGKNCARETIPKGGSEPFKINLVRVLTAGEAEALLEGRAHIVGAGRARFLNEGDSQLQTRNICYEYTGAPGNEERACPAPRE